MRFLANRKGDSIFNMIERRARDHVQIIDNLQRENEELRQQNAALLLAIAAVTKKTDPAH
jgi:hypothetical protein